jgi:hypothetical protein
MTVVCVPHPTYGLPMHHQIGKSGKVEVKVYLVFQRMNVGFGDETPNIRIIAAKLNRKSALDVISAVPGTWCEKIIADRHVVETLVQHVADVAETHAK